MKDSITSDVPHVTSDYAIETRELLAISAGRDTCPVDIADFQKQDYDEHLNTSIPISTMESFNSMTHNETYITSRIRPFFRQHQNLREFFCGGTAAVINIVLTFPPNKIMFRQQLYGFTVREAYYNVREEGLHMLYRGVRPPLVQATISKSIMFGLFNWFDRFFIEQFGHEKPYIHVIAAGFSGTTEAILTPFERAQTLLQTPKFNAQVPGAIAAIFHINQYGIREHYRGLSAILLRNGPANIVFFGLRDHIRQIVPHSDTPSGRLLRDFTAGGLLGAFTSTLCFPINVARARMQSVCGDPYFMGTFETLKLMYKERGGNARELYRGVQINFFRSLFSWGIINSTYEKLKEIT